MHKLYSDIGRLSTKNSIIEIYNYNPCFVLHVAVILEDYRLKILLLKHTIITHVLYSMWHWCLAFSVVKKHEENKCSLDSFGQSRRTK